MARATSMMLRLDLATVVAEAEDLGGGKRWVVVRPHATGTGLLFVRATDESQETSIGNQTAGRVSFFLHTDDLDRQVAEWTLRGGRFADQPRTEPYGKVVVFPDVHGNRWDLIESSER